MSTPATLLKRYWGYDTFRPGQAEIIASILQGKDTLAILPTGGGKSICYQVPALLQPGLFLVISPLIALMRDQVENLRKRGITAYAIHTGMSRADVINILTVAAESNCKLLYVSPERLTTPLFQEYLPSLDIRGIAVDEAHCISQWGYDFRPAYLRIAELREQVPNVPILALTASATQAIQEDICNKLSSEEDQIDKWNLFRNSFERANLSYSVLLVPDKIQRLRQILEKLAGTGIVYGRSRKGVEQTAEQIAQWGISAAFYHAGLSLEERRKREREWMGGAIRVMVCTNAFGMGIDKPDVRFVVHVNAPDSMENYYQEAGRAGRDGKKAYAILLTEPGTITELEEKGRMQFPTLEEVRKIYQSVANYLQMPVGAGEGEWFDFDLMDFRKKFKHPSYGLKQAFALLEENQWLTYNEELFFPPQVQVLGGRESSDLYESEAPREIELLRTLLRLYGGIRDQPTGISERALAKAMKWDTEFIVILLNRLQAMGLIDYQPKKEKPQIQLLQPRASAPEIRLDAKRYTLRKTEAEKRLMAMLQYIKEGSVCRSKWIGNYFGDSTVRDCDICDNCLERKKRSKAIDRVALNDQVLEILRGEPMNWMEIQEKFPEVTADQLKAAIDFLIGEERIMVDADGNLRANGS
ncbi:MAG: ATP-dependent DNA helicase RecQ [Bacteroidota bacterium]